MGKSDMERFMHVYMVSALKISITENGYMIEPSGDHRSFLRGKKPHEEIGN